MGLFFFVILLLFGGEDVYLLGLRVRRAGAALGLLALLLGLLVRRRTSPLVEASLGLLATAPDTYPDCLLRPALYITQKLQFLLSLK